MHTERQANKHKQTDRQTEGRTDGRIEGLKWELAGGQEGWLAGERTDRRADGCCNLDMKLHTITVSHKEHKHDTKNIFNDIRSALIFMEKSNELKMRKAKYHKLLYMIKRHGE